MSNTRAQEVLYESEAALRLVDHELTNLRDVRDASDASAALAPPPALSLAELPQFLEEANAQILSVLSRLRESRATPGDALFLVTGAPRFPGITSLQLSRSSTVLAEMEERLLEVARLIETRQALADELFTASRAPAA